MQTIKTIVVVALLLTVCYGAYIAMNAPEVQVPEDLKQWAEKSGNDVIPDFSIPPITDNDLYSPGGNKSQPNSNVGLPTFPQVASDVPSSVPLATPSLPDSFGTPQFPPVAGSGGDLLAGSLGTNTPSSTSTSNPNFANPPTNDFAPQSGASLAGNSSSSAASLNPGLSGPAIPFNPSMPGESPKLDNAANELINAGSTFGSAQLLDTNPQKSTESLVSTSPNFNSIASSTDNKGEQKATPPTKPFPTARAEALQWASQGKLREALESLTQYYESPDLGYEDHKDLVDILDALSREVIYSDRHLLLPAHTVTALDSLQSLSAKLNLNPELLAAINKMGSATALVPNTQIKVLEGPFHAQVSLSRGELTLFLRKMYAGRFPISISQKNRPAVARYEVVDRRQDRTYYAAKVVIPAGDPSNPYGGFWLSLGGDISIHGSPEQVPTDLDGAGCISLSPLDAADVYRILTKGASVEIRQ